MSTLFTEIDEELLASINLGQLISHAHHRILDATVTAMHAKGYDYLSGAHLTFMSHLDCGVTHASAVARRMGISRQAVYRTTRELQTLKVLTLKTDPNDKRQKIITMTELGNQIALDARASFAEIEKEMENNVGGTQVKALTEILKNI